MVSYLILCRSLTYAQRMVRALEHDGIKGRVTRLPRSIAGEGCGYCVRVVIRNIGVVLGALREEGLTPKQIYMENADGSLSEVVR